jgi:DNA invertase Pin-like site-specific DNA recombinase
MPRPKGGSLKLVRDYSAVRDVLIPYRRVSTREQADKGAGLPAQKTVLTAGLTVRSQQALTWDCVDRGKSGKDLKRPELTRALQIVENGEAGGIIVSKLDRLSRSLLDFAYLMAKAQKEGWNIVALDLGVDLSTPAGQAMAGMLAIFAEFERNVIRQRTRDALAEKREDGVRLGRPRAIDDDLLAAIVQAYLADSNFSAVARWLNDAAVETPHGGRMWYPASVQKVVQSQDGARLVEMWQELSTV